MLKAVAEAKPQGFLIDGFPRDTTQAEEFTKQVKPTTRALRLEPVRCSRDSLFNFMSLLPIVHEYYELIYSRNISSFILRDWHQDFGRFISLLIISVITKDVGFRLDYQKRPYTSNVRMKF